MAWYRFARFVAVLLAIAVFAAGAPALPKAFAADVVVALELEDDAPVHLYVDHETHQLKALATLQGVTAKKDVTSSAIWASSNNGIVKADKGKLTPVGAGTAKVSAKYEGKTVYVTVNVDFLYESVRLNAESAMAVELKDEPLELTAEAIESDGTAFDVTADAVWTSSDPSVASVNDGEVKLLKSGASTITAKYKGRSDTVALTVTSPYESLAIEADDDEFEYLVGETGVELEAVAELVNGASENVSEEANWSSSHPSVVAVEDGKLTFKAQGVAEISATRFGHVAKASVVVRLPYQALLLTPSEPLRLFVTDDPVDAKAEVANDFDSRTNVTNSATWTTSNPLVVSADKGSIRPRGAGEAEVTVAYRGLQKKLSVIVMPVVDGLQIEDEALTLFRGEVAALPAVNGTDLNGVEYTFTDIAEWSSSDETIVSIENGKLKAGKPGTAVLTMKLRSETETVTVQVREKALALLPSANEYTLVRGDEVPLPAVKAILEDGSEVDVAQSIEWAASSPNLLVAGGKMKALLASKVTLTGTYLNKKVTIPVTIKDKMTNVAVEPASITLHPKQSETIKVTALGTDGKTTNVSRDVVWNSSDPDVATVSGSSVKAVGQGKAVLTADYQGNELKVNVSVVAKLEKVQLSVKKGSVRAGASSTLQLVAYYDDGTTKDVTSQAVWSTSDVFVATVASGKVTGVKKGTATIKAKFDNKTATARFTVTE